MTTVASAAQQLCVTPTIDATCVCIVDRESVALAAVISSYFAEPDVYFAIFDFPRVQHANGPDGAGEDDTSIARMIGNEHAVTIMNALAKLRQCRRVLLAGLNDVQDSYFAFPEGFDVVRISGIRDVDAAFARIGITIGRELHCRPDEALVGLQAARSAGARLVIDAEASALPAVATHGGGMVVVERLNHVSSVVAVNLAHAVSANLAVVAPLNEDEPREILAHLQEWRDNASAGAFTALETKIQERIGHLVLDRLSYVTYFTAGLPYALATTATLPTSYVHMQQHAGLFVFNAIDVESAPRAGVAFIFALDESEMAGEAAWLDQFLTEHHYHVRSLVGARATHDAFDYNAQNFPYNILHIASHGGEVSGYDVTQRFVDRDGNEHVVHFDEVIALGTARDEHDRIKVQSKAIFRTFDGFVWKSQPLRDRRYPSYVFEDMIRAMNDREAWKTNATRIPKTSITSSCSIQCADGIHQGMFRQIAAYRGTPLVFNNACWSWSDIADSFVSGGARAYVGTLWSIETDTAVIGAQVFYQSAFAGNPIVAALNQAREAIRTTRDNGIYMVWGLPFSTLPMPSNSDASDSRMLHNLMQLLDMYIRQVLETKAQDARRNALAAARQIYVDIVTNFDFEGMPDFAKTYRYELDQLSPPIRSATVDAPALRVETGDSLDLLSQPIPLASSE